MDSDTLVKVEGVSKKFCRDLKRSLMYGVQDLGKSLLGINSNHQLRKKEFWAVDDISFELKRGECLGLIGHNGAGKSTLLKMLNGLITPDKGRIEMRGRVGALIELGAGFNPILTGRENVYNNGAVLGFSKSEIDDRLDDIIDFSEIGEFIDAPVQSYSSGMKVRLGFAVAAQLEPDVLIIDEVLAVGDINFKRKCLSKMEKIKQNSSLIFVSHDMNQVSRICERTLLLNQGKLESNGNTRNSISKYYSIFNKDISPTLLIYECTDGLGKFILKNGIEEKEELKYKFGEPLDINFQFYSDIEINDPIISFRIEDYANNKLVTIKNIHQENNIINKINIGYNTIKVIIDNRFIPGVYYLGVKGKAKNNSTLFNIGGLEMNIEYDSRSIHYDGVMTVNSEWKKK